jgi:hypothetical protein
VNPGKGQPVLSQTAPVWSSKQFEDFFDHLKFILY